MSTADELCDLVAFVVDGRIVCAAQTAELKIARSQPAGAGGVSCDRRCTGKRRVSMDGWRTNPAFHVVLCDHDVETIHSRGSQPRRRLRRGHRKAADVTRLGKRIFGSSRRCKNRRFLHVVVFSGPDPGGCRCCCHVVRVRSPSS